MYGYVRPVKDELRVREYETFRGVYCGLCHRLRERYGPIARFAVNYDLTFLAMLLADAGPVEACRRRCPYHPLRRAACPAGLGSMDAAADITVILAYWKLMDGAADKGFFGRIGCRIAAAALRGAYKRASRAMPAFAAETEAELRALAALEAEESESLDAAADKFALILRAAAEGASYPARARVLRELLYHLGRVIYVLDAVDDLSEDERTGAYNPLRYRFTTENGKLRPEDEKELRLSLQHSHNSMLSAFALLEKNPYTDILENILCLGLPSVTQAVFSGAWRDGRNRKERSEL